MIDLGNDYLSKVSYLGQPVSNKPKPLEIYKTLKKQAVKNPELISQSITQLEDSYLRYKICKIVVKQGKNEISKEITIYNLGNKDRLFKIAKIDANVHGKEVAENISNYNLDQTQRFEIAKIIVLQEGNSVSDNLRKFDLDPNQRFEIAKLCAINGKLSRKIKNYDLDQQQRFEAAKLEAVGRSGYISTYIEDFDLDQEQRFEVAKNAAFNDKYFVKSVKGYDLTSSQRFEVAKIAAARHGTMVAKKIGKFDLNPTQVFQIAKIIAQRPKSIHKHIQKFKIEDVRSLFQLLEMEIATHPKKIAAILKSYALNEDDYQKFLLLSTFLSDNSFQVEERNSSWVPLIRNIKKIPATELSSEQLSSLQNALRQTILETHSTGREVGKAMIEWVDSIKESENLIARQRQLSWVANVCAVCVFYKVSSDEWDFMRPIFNSLSTLTDPILRGKISHHLIVNYLGDENSAKRDMQKYLAYNEMKEQVQIMAAMIAPIALEGEQACCEHLIKAFYSNKKMSAIGSSQRMIFELLFNLQEEEWTAREQSLLLEKLISKLTNVPTVEKPNLKGLTKEARKLKLQEHRNNLEKPNAAFTEMLNSAQIVQDLLLLKKGEALKQISSVEDIKLILQSLYLEILGEIKVEDFLAKYVATFGQFRNKQALWTYYARLSTLSPSLKRETLPWLQNYVKNVLEGTFLKNRYLKTDHLDTIFQARPDLEKKWKKADMVKLSKLEEVSTDILSPENLFLHFQEMILVENHLDQRDYPYVFAYLQNSESAQSALEKIKSKRNEVIQLNKEASNKKANAQVLNKLKFEQCFLEIFIPNAKIEKSLEELARIAPSECEFKQDLEGLLRKVTSVPSVYGNLIAVNTDDPCDFLLMGEFEKSCQKVNGNPKLNRGLLGYMTNGQNRIIAVKNANGEMISRALIRLLWDKKNETPVLYLEPIYTRVEDTKLNTLLIEMAKRSAKELNLPLIMAIDPLEPERPTYPNAIYSLGGQCPFEFVDALGSYCVTSSAFTIHRGVLLN